MKKILFATVALLVVAGAAFALIGCIGLLRFRTFYERIHLLQAARARLCRADLQLDRLLYRRPCRRRVLQRQQFQRPLHRQ